MIQDKYSAVWVSHSSLGDFSKCPRSYYLKNVYKNPKTGKKINIVSPALSLGSAVHQVVEGLGAFKVEERFTQNLEEEFEKAWAKYSGKKGGFLTEADEKEAKERGLAMIRRVAANPGPLKNKTVKLPEREMLPNFYLSEADNIILCGKIDWIEYIPEDDSIRVLDFKTGKNEEKEDSLQLPIYLLLLKNLQKRKVSGAAYWYLDKDDAPVAVKLPDVDKAFADVLEKAKKVKEAREEKGFFCPKGEKGCFACRPFEKILKGEAECLGVGEYNQELYLVN
ncbi:MAG: PD-(D/E)XK nuclease family protein [Candidatus Pacebacteria bacterium]|nr:PD-(D/E)XK nuclease family protein [Candidatus Paceibacterota bacterium]